MADVFGKVDGGDRLAVRASVSGMSGEVFVGGRDGGEPGLAGRRVAAAVDVQDMGRRSGMEAST